MNKSRLSINLSNILLYIREFSSNHDLVVKTADIEDWNFSFIKSIPNLVESAVRGLMILQDTLCTLPRHPMNRSFEDRIPGPRACTTTRRRPRKDYAVAHREVFLVIAVENFFIKPLSSTWRLRLIQMALRSPPLSLFSISLSSLSRLLSDCVSLSLSITASHPLALLVSTSMNGILSW